MSEHHDPSRRLRALPPPATSFASDNAAGADPVVLEALAAANDGPAVAYGDDRWTASFDERIRAMFGADAVGLLCWGGTGANVIALGALLAPWQGVVCPSSAHVNVDECGAPERFGGHKLIDVPTADGKLRPDDVRATLPVLGDVHHVQPGAISITQSTECGTLYTMAELVSLAGLCRDAGLRVHVDGARLANAVAALGVDVASLAGAVGADIISFGGTKNGLVHGDAVVVLDPALVEPARFIRKQAAQLPSKMRFVAAQFSALLDGDRWVHNASRANAMARRLADAVTAVDGVEITQPTEVNAVFARLPRSRIAALQSWSPFYTWQPGPDPLDGAEPLDEVRWMTSFATSEADVDAFVAGIAAAMGA